MALAMETDLAQEVVLLAMSCRHLSRSRLYSSREASQLAINLELIRSKNSERVIGYAAGPKFGGELALAVLFPPQDIKHPMATRTIRVRGVLDKSTWETSMQAQCLN
jgi:hypothetical protein